MPNLLNALINLVDEVQASKTLDVSKPASWLPGAPTIDVVVPHRGDSIVSLPAYSDKPISAGLMMTLTSCERVLADSNLERKYFIVSNGNPYAGPEAEAFERAVQYVRDTGNLGQVVYQNSQLSPPSARNAGAAAGHGDLIFFFDNHCFVNEGYFNRAIETIETVGADCLHGATQNLHQAEGQHSGSDGQTGFHHIITAEEFKGLYTLTPPSSPKPYRIAACGHGAFVVKRSSWQDVGGYWDGFVGFAGEELYFALKLAMLNKTTWMDPRISHWHHTQSVRAYKNNVLQEWPVIATNIVAAANIIGGNQYAETVATNRCRKALRNVPGPLSWHWYRNRLLEVAIERSEDHRRWFDSVKKRTLEEQLRKFQVDGVAC